MKLTHACIIYGDLKKTNALTSFFLLMMYWRAILTRLTDTPAHATQFLIVSVPRLSVVAKERKAWRKSTNTLLRAMSIA